MRPALAQVQGESVLSLLSFGTSKMLYYSVTNDKIMFVVANLLWSTMGLLRTHLPVALYFLCYSNIPPTCLSCPRISCPSGDSTLLFILSL
jgi:hypothetical protein